MEIFSLNKQFKLDSKWFWPNHIWVEDSAYIMLIVILNNNKNQAVLFLNQFLYKIQLLLLKDACLC